MADKDALLPCPFCGGAGSFGKARANHFVNCIKCLAATDHLSLKGLTQEEAAALWNTRVPQGATEGLNKAAAHCEFRASSNFIHAEGIKELTAMAIHLRGVAKQEASPPPAARAGAPMDAGLVQTLRDVADDMDEDHPGQESVASAAIRKAASLLDPAPEAPLPGQGAEERRYIDRLEFAIQQLCAMAEPIIAATIHSDMATPEAGSILELNSAVISARHTIERKRDA